MRIGGTGMEGLDASIVLRTCDGRCFSREALSCSVAVEEQTLPRDLSFVGGHGSREMRRWKEEREQLAVILHGRKASNTFSNKNGICLCTLV